MSKKSTISHFPVGNGDMTLLKIASNNKYHYILIDMHIRQNSADDTDKCDVLSALHEMLEKDCEGRPYIDLLILTHPDEDHIQGFGDHFHQGAPVDYKTPKKGEQGKIFIREIWSSPIIFRRKSKNHSLCQDANDFNREAKRRVELFRNSKKIGAEGNRVRLLGKDENGKTDDIEDIVYLNGEAIDTINEVFIKELSALVLGPLEDDEFEDESELDKNRSSIIIQWSIASHGYTRPTNQILLAGDAGVEVWDIMWEKYESEPINLEYDILLAPHHCSWRTLSHDSYSKSDNPQVSEKAKNALGQAKEGAVVLSSSDSIKNDKNDPPNYEAMQTYKKIVNNVDGSFKCLAEHKPSKKKAPEVLTYKLTNSGPQEDSTGSIKTKSNSSKRTSAASALFASTGSAIGHG